MSANIITIASTTPPPSPHYKWERWNGMNGRCEKEHQEDFHIAGNQLDNISIRHTVWAIIYSGFLSVLKYIPIPHVRNLLTPYHSLSSFHSFYSLLVFYSGLRRGELFSPSQYDILLPFNQNTCGLILHLFILPFEYSARVGARKGCGRIVQEHACPDQLVQPCRTLGRKSP